MAVLTALVASVVSGLFALTLLRRFVARGRANPALLFWGLAMVLYCVASVGLLGIAAAGGILSFLGDTVGHAIGFTAGVVVMYGGFVRATRPVDRRAPVGAAGAGGPRAPGP